MSTPTGFGPGRRRGLPAIALACTMIATGLLATPAAQPKVDLSPKALVARMSRYVGEYAEKLKRVIAEATYIQETYASREVRTGSRRMRGDLFLEFLPADREWIAIHDIAEVDGQPVTDRQELSAILARGATMSVVRELAARNARYNIGNVNRNFNEPTLALLIVDASRVSHSEFSRLGVEPVAGATLVTLAFEERKNHRTIISRAETYDPVRTQGEIVMEAETGRIRQTRLAFKYDTIQAELRTVYMPDARLGVLVPSLFTEHYEKETNGLKEIIICSARYTNYQRFETSGRIKR